MAVQRNPFPQDNSARFAAWLIEHATLYGVLDDPEVFVAVENLHSLLTKRLAKRFSKKISESSDVKRFIYLFKQLYMKIVGWEYQDTCKSSQYVIIQNLVEKLKNCHVTVEDYLNWLFQEYFPDHPNLSIGLGLSISNNMVNEFIQANVSLLNERKDKIYNQQKEKELASRARTVIRQNRSHPDAIKLAQMIKGYRAGEPVSLDEIRDLIVRLEREPVSSKENDGGNA